MARGDGVNRTNVRNVRLTTPKLSNMQQHNEREKDSYINQDIVSNRTHLNVHYKAPTDDYLKMFQQMEAEGSISTRGIKENAYRYGELIFDVNSAYFYNHCGYDFAKQFYNDAYKSAIEIVGGEQYILSAVMHADERNRAMSEALGQDVYHYHLHVVYIPVVEKQILWSKRCKDESLRGTVKQTIKQVSMSKKWDSKPAFDESGARLFTTKGKPVLRKSYSVLQDDFYTYMRTAGYDDVERGERGSSEEHLTVTQFKVAQEQERLVTLTEKAQEKVRETNLMETKFKKIQKQQFALQSVERITAMPVPLSSKVILERTDYESLLAAAKKYIIQEKQEHKLYKLLDVANKMIAELKAKVAVLTKELFEYKSIRNKLNIFGLKQENDVLRGKIDNYEAAIERNNLWHFFDRRSSMTRARDGNR